ncbi:MAG: sigma-70 family RNA polymerase sigma factor [Coriobacteriales bacterium]|jgi:RNA polymerase sigma-70 factor (ECF subfamily)|nr:sigma-70 family RNA polymerase sigma factor [Coriobacteriales bacterium]
MDESHLIERLKQGDTQTLDAVIHRYGGYVMAVVRNTLGSVAHTEDCEELVSDVFVLLWRNAFKLRPDSALKPWLAVVARNASLNWARKQRPQAAWDEALLESELFMRENPTASAAELLEQQERDCLLNTAVQELDKQSKDILIRYYHQEQPIKRIAAETGLSESAVKSRLHRARRTLHFALQQKGVTP